MTNKSLSQQICEVCGIEPKGKLVFEKRNWDKKSWLSAGARYKQFDFESTPNVTVDIIPTEFYNEKNGFQYPYSRIDEIKKLYDKNGYDFIEFTAKFIDFENNNNNFVKLMELDFDSCSDGDIRFPSLWCFLNSFMFALESREDYLIYLLSFLKDNRSEWRENLQRDVKQAIRQAEWEV